MNSKRETQKPALALHTIGAYWIRINVGVKIGSKAIEKRLENALPHIIHCDQNAFVRGRNIFDAAVRTMVEARWPYG